MMEKITINVNSIRSLYITTCYNETKLATATGFVVNKNDEYYLITNRHVVTGRNNETGECLDSVYGAIPNVLKVWLPYKVEDGFEWNSRKIDLYDSNEKNTWLEHPIYKDKVDVVALKIEKYDEMTFCHNVISDYKPVVTENVFIIGYPFGFNINPGIGRYGIWSTGIVASDPDLDLVIKGNQLPAFLVDAKTRHGQSGSPVIYYKSAGMVRQNDGSYSWQSQTTYGIGIYSGRINKDSDLGYVWKWNLIQEIINQ